MLWFRAPQKVYFKKGCLPVALQELREVMDKKRAFIVTDQFLYANGYAKPVTDQLDQMGIAYDVFYDVAPDPTPGLCQDGRGRMRAFGPDCIIAIGGGSAMDAGKIMWVMYEHPRPISWTWPCDSWTSASGCTLSPRWGRRPPSSPSPPPPAPALR